MPEFEYFFPLPQINFLDTSAQNRYIPDNNPLAFANMFCKHPKNGDDKKTAYRVFSKSGDNCEFAREKRE